ncbi:MAG: SpaA isopeptide-forming pilin-related protein [Clostridiales bacterium]|nr:SpaA isopeptide-forming pilin-related protein [Clostridiales bacterium]MDY2729158.1 SpaA isopeptide-forming pilin-related protein [Clostridium sp.]NLK23471.1 hypothetical protein [Clostridiales bacterium]
MDKEPINKTCITNMEEKDPIINKYMNDYMKSVQEFEDVKGNEKLIVNFDITYPDGRCENFTCNGVSDVFGKGSVTNKRYSKDKNHNQKKEKECVSRKKKKELSDEEKDIEKCKKYYENKDYYCDEDFYDEDYIKNEYAEFFNEYKKNFECVKSNKDDKFDDGKGEELKNERCKKEDKEETGEINVYAYLGNIKGIELKGVSINLYKINGVCPELIECKQTDNIGKASFKNIPNGSYRIIEVIDKKYFLKPTYVNWNEVNITKSNKCFTIYIINKMK